MSIFKSRLFWISISIWALANAFAILTIRSVSGLDARTWPILSLDPEWSGQKSDANQIGFVALFIASYLLFLLAGYLVGRAFEQRFGSNIFARLSIFSGVVSQGGFVLWAVAWRITMWLEDMGFYQSQLSNFDLMVNLVPFGSWLVGGAAFYVFLFLAAKKMIKARYS